jgi:AcrR family transcriptional regulator
VAQSGTDDTRRTPLNRERVLRTAVTLADADGIDEVSMRRLAQELGVVPMALYKHVANKEELLDGMVEIVVGEIAPPEAANAWKPAVRARILSAREALLRHPWARRVLESRETATPTVLAYMDSMIAMFRGGGLSIDLTHHVMHAIGSRMFGFNQELYTDNSTAADTPTRAAMLDQLGQIYPHIAEIARRASHDEASVIGPGCDDQFEFEFSLDLMLDGFERLHERNWTSVQTLRLSAPRNG